MHVCCWLQFESRREKRHGSDVDADGRPDADTGDVHRGNPDVQPSVCGSECHQSAYQDGCRHAQLSNSLLHRMWHHGRGTERLLLLLTLLRTLLTFYCFMTATLTSLGTQNCDERVCLFVCLCLSVQVSRSIFPELPVQFLPILHVTYGRGLVLLWRRCDTICRLSLFWFHG